MHVHMEKLYAAIEQVYSIDGLGTMTQGDRDILMLDLGQLLSDGVLCCWLLGFKTLTEALNSSLNPLPWMAVYDLKARKHYVSVLYLYLRS